MIIVGLGNPGKKYYYNRHNIGFRVIDEWAKELNAQPAGNSFFSEQYEAFYDDTKVRLFKPQTYMNESGRAVQAIINYYKQPLESILVVCDELDIPFGQFRVKQKGSPGTHNGLRSIVQSVGRSDFKRLRFGIGPKPVKKDAATFVLSNFSNVEESQIVDLMTRLKVDLQTMMKQEWGQVMQSLNKRPIT